MSILKLQIQDFENVETPKEGWVVLGFSDVSGTSYLTQKDEYGNISYPVSGSTGSNWT